MFSSLLKYASLGKLEKSWIKPDGMFCVLTHLLCYCSLKLNQKGEKPFQSLFTNDLLIPTSCSVSTHNVDHSLALTGRKLSQGVRHRGHTRPPVLLRTVTLHRAQTLATYSVQLPLCCQQLEVGPKEE